MPRNFLSLSEARRIALAAQGFDRPRPTGVVKDSQLRRTIRQLGLLQIDFVNVLAPAHCQVLFSRLGPFEKSRLDKLVYRKREFTEQWAHEASIVPVETWPLLRYRMETHQVRPYGFEKFMEQCPAYVDRVLEEVRDRGPLTADDLADPDTTPRRLAEAAWLGTVPRRLAEAAWPGTVPRAVLEARFGRGALAVAGRLPNFTRTYDLTERVLPAEHHGRHVGRDEAQRELLRLAARSYGIGTASDLADYYRMPVREARPRLAELVETGELTLVQVQGWREPAYLHCEARLPRRIDGSALLSPFDPVVWFRPRLARLFEFDYRFEIFVPQPKRRWGCYVLPFLMGDRLVARVDLKADRSARRLLVLSAYVESHAEARTVAEALAAELWTLATWLKLESIAVGRRGGLSRSLRAALAN